MLVIRNLDNINIETPSAITIGAFDGIHLGHKKLIDKVKELSKQSGSTSCLLTFYPHPQKVVSNNNLLKLLTPLDEKLLKLSQMDLEKVIIIPFSKSFANMSYKDFVQNILVEKLKISHLVMGDNHGIGRHREGSIDEINILAKKNNFQVEVITPAVFEESCISSTLIRGKIAAGDVCKAAKMLGHKYSIFGKVVSGNEIGRKMGFPTANIRLNNNEKLIPKKGVYATSLIVDNEVFNGMTNIGYRPTLDAENLTIEMNIFDFDKSIYNKQVELVFWERLRDEIRFPNLESLIEQLEKDREKCKNIFH